MVEARRTLGLRNPYEHGHIYGAKESRNCSRHSLYRLLSELS